LARISGGIMPSGLQDLLTIIDKGYEDTLRRDERRVQTSLALMESSANRALQAEKYAFEKGSKLLALSQNLNDANMSKLANNIYGMAGGALYDEEDEGKSLKAYMRTGFGKNWKQDPMGISMYNALVGYSTQPERYRDSILDLGEDMLAMRMSDRDLDPETGVMGVKEKSNLSKLMAMGVITTEEDFELLEGVPVARANEKDIGREMYEFIRGDTEIDPDSLLGIRGYEDIIAGRMADAYGGGPEEEVVGEAEVVAPPLEVEPPVGDEETVVHTPLEILNEIGMEGLATDLRAMAEGVEITSPSSDYKRIFYSDRGEALRGPTNASYYRDISVSDMEASSGRFMGMEFPGTKERKYENLDSERKGRMEALEEGDMVQMGDDNYEIEDVPSNRARGDWRVRNLYTNKSRRMPGYMIADKLK